MKKKYFKYLFIINVFVIIFSSCLTAPKEGVYRDSKYEDLIQKHGKPTFDGIYTIGNNLELGFTEPSYGLYFSKEELENGVQIRKLIWEKSFNIRLMVWLRNLNGEWTAFDSLEYNSKYIAF
ncbi:MAG: hypothetical protein LBI28_10530 [Treponema sp.]|nr:hypothetical protein [Treponema sp.]